MLCIEKAKTDGQEDGRMAGGENENDKLWWGATKETAEIESTVVIFEEQPAVSIIATRKNKSGKKEERERGSGSSDTTSSLEVSRLK